MNLNENIAIETCHKQSIMNEDTYFFYLVSWKNADFQAKNYRDLPGDETISVLICNP